MPRIEQIKIPKDFIGAVIGKGGEVIQKIQAETNTIINIEEDGEFGIVDVASSNKDDIAAALKWIKDICTVPEVGDVYDAKVVSIVEFGAFMEFLPGKEGLMHISEYEWGHPETLEGLIQVGDEFQVKVIAFDEKNGKIKLSRKALLPKPARTVTVVRAATATAVASAAVPATVAAVADNIRQSSVCNKETRLKRASFLYVEGMLSICQQESLSFLLGLAGQRRWRHSRVQGWRRRLRCRESAGRHPARHDWSGSRTFSAS